MLEMTVHRNASFCMKKPQAKLSAPLSRSTPNLAMGFSSEFINVLCKLSYFGAARQRSWRSASRFSIKASLWEITMSIS
jgi:hypothetical protein